MQAPDASQQSLAVQQMAAAVAKILTPGEEIRYIAMQNQTAVSLKKRGVIATSHRLIMYAPGVLGGDNFHDQPWRNIQLYLCSFA